MTLAATTVSLSGEVLPKESPFLPPATVAAPPVSSVAGYRLGGMTVVGDKTLLSVIRESDKRSEWIAVGQTVGEITVISYDTAKEQATIRAADKQLVLTMPAPSVVAPTSTEPPTDPSTPSAEPAESEAIVMPPLSPQEEKEMEARMLVTDLLEIGQRQRKAYAEAQRQAALKGTSMPPPAAAAPTPAPPKSE